jgi:membrane protein YqaA with SNARE-associated domain
MALERPGGGQGPQAHAKEQTVQAASLAATTGETIRALGRSWQAVSVRDRVRSILGLIAIVVISAALVSLPIDYEALGTYGYVGVFVVTLISTAAIVLPVPYLATIVVAGSYLDPRMVAVVAGLAAALGEITGYLLGYTGRSLLPENRAYAFLQRMMLRFGGIVVFVGSVIPNPFFDAIGMVAGATKMPLWVFLLCAFIGKTMRFWLLAMAGFALIAH